MHEMRTQDSVKNHMSYKLASCWGRLSLVQNPVQNGQIGGLNLDKPDPGSPSRRAWKLSKHSLLVPLPILLITALAVETLSVTLLAWLPLAASVSLSALLTVILLPVAILRARQSPLFAAMTLAMLAMVWRGEAWKTVFL